VSVIGAAWWRLDRAIFYMVDTLGMDLPSEVLGAWEQSREEASGALPQL
jgi:hypothetical protein